MAEEDRSPRHFKLLQEPNSLGRPPARAPPVALLPSQGPRPPRPHARVSPPLPVPLPSSPQDTQPLSPAQPPCTAHERAGVRVTGDEDPLPFPGDAQRDGRCSPARPPRPLVSSPTLPGARPAITWVLHRVATAPPRARSRALSVCGADVLKLRTHSSRRGATTLPPTPHSSAAASAAVTSLPSIGWCIPRPLPSQPIVGGRERESGPARPSDPRRPLGNVVAGPGGRAAKKVESVGAGPQATRPALHTPLPSQGGAARRGKGYLSD
uniref:uncharacterized protein LOC108592339 n=1 Tax=Callithrix jacchus TaxID=9483 RepID=UPI0023DD2A5A|nr:uncharacterized protein LOC108592339 [Callithrix jacchus]